MLGAETWSNGVNHCCNFYPIIPIRRQVFDVMVGDQTLREGGREGEGGKKEEGREGRGRKGGGREGEIKGER